ncbi:MCE family protein [Thermoleophilum album]|uniref:MlaD family protein n=1 Tax=Thermoleophilum album TaxID=29539 RepID=UPI00237CEF00|nr:MlaD family protein [Thermoleophilum album]WDT93976.1 MCE family protein [Thermoleophilum album]
MMTRGLRTGQLVAIVGFSLSCFLILIFLWVAFGGTLPLAPQSYRLQVAFPEAAQLADEADVRISGVNVGKVKDKRLDLRSGRTLATLEIEPDFAPLPRDTRAILRQKTLLGETYVELTPGHRSAGTLPDGARLPDSQVQRTVELDEIFRAFDPETRRNFQEWMQELAAVGRNTADRDLNDAFGNFPRFAADATDLLRIADEQRRAVRTLVRDGGTALGAVTARRGELRRLVEGTAGTFAATASRDRALAETFRIFPVFLAEARATMRTLEDFSGRTRPVIRTLRQPADDLRPTLRALRQLSPDLRALFRQLDPLIATGRRTLPDLERLLRGADPLFEAARVFFPELNPILAYFNFHQATIAGFLSNAGPDLSSKVGGTRGQTQVGIIDSRSLALRMTRPDWERGNAYLQPNAIERATALGTFESFDCSPAGGEQPNPNDALDAPPIPLIKDAAKRPPCFEAPPSLYDGKLFVIPQRGDARLRPRPTGRAGNRPAVDPNPDDPAR